ncbi:MAG TPA: hypothetical protein VJ949_04560, partial [Cryomorphaceae bacterium]|nr:hypothetical protein [Cryomorphaceae bacterium]
KDSFCIQTLECENSIFTVNDTLTDERFKNNIYVTGQPYIRYYIGAPLVTPRGIKIGTICLLDTKERGLGADKKHGIELIAKKIIRHLEQKKLLIEQNKQIEFDQKRLRFLTDNVPGAIFQLDYSHDREEYNFSFISAGISELHPALKPKRLKDDPFLLSDLVHPEDKECFIESITTASRELVPWVKEFRLVNNHGSKWIRGIAVPRQYKKITEWYGVFENIDYLKEYQLTLEGIAFDISHGLRKPVTNLLGLIDIFDKDKMSQEDTENFNSYVKEVSVELEKFTKELNQTYYKKRTDFQEMVAKSKRLQS